MSKILVIEDEKPISDIIKFNLEKEGFEIITAYDGLEGLSLARSVEVDLILLDIMLPGMDGFEVCKKVREQSNVPIIMATAKAEEVDKVLGLEFGADDYITKPFSIRELTARIKANIRRTAMPIQQMQNDTAKQSIQSGNLLIDLLKYEVSKSGEVIPLTVREFDLLKFLALQKEQVFSREQLLASVWGYEYYGDMRTVDVTVRRLREKIEDDSAKPEFIMTRRGVGYYFKGE